MTTLFNSPAHALSCLRLFGVLDQVRTHDDKSVTVYLRRNTALHAYHQDVVMEAITFLEQADNGRYVTRYPSYGRSLFVEPPVPKSKKGFIGGFAYIGGSISGSTPAPSDPEPEMSLSDRMVQGAAARTIKVSYGDGAPYWPSEPVSISAAPISTQPTSQMPVDNETYADWTHRLIQMQKGRRLGDIA